MTLHCYASLVDRLRGIYTIPVNDGAGPLNGKDTFTRKFDGLPPINEEAAKAIDAMALALVEIATAEIRAADSSVEYPHQRDTYKLRSIAREVLGIVDPERSEHHIEADPEVLVAIIGELKQAKEKIKAIDHACLDTIHTLGKIDRPTDHAKGRITEARELRKVILSS